MSNDPLAGWFTGGRIDYAQFLAGRRFQWHVGQAGRPIPDNPTVTDAQRWLTNCYRQLGVDGSALVHDALIRGMSARQIATARGRTGPDWDRYFARRIRKCLNTLAEVYGFAGGEKTIRASGARTLIIGTP